LSTTGSKTSAPKRRAPRQARAKATVDAILEAARDLFARDCRLPTAERIAERAGVSIGTFYQYFANKQAVIEALAERHLDEASVHLLPVIETLGTEGARVEDDVTRVVGAMIALHAHDPALHRHLSAEAVHSPAIAKRFDEVMEASAALAADYLVRTRSLDAQTAALRGRLLAETLEALTHRVVIEETVPLENAGAEIIRLLSAMIRA